MLTTSVNFKFFMSIILLQIILSYNGRFYTKDALSVWTNLGKCFVVRLGYASLV